MHLRLVSCYMLQQLSSIYDCEHEYFPILRRNIRLFELSRIFYDAMEVGFMESKFRC